jgi:hypothetical protein
MLRARLVTLKSSLGDAKSSLRDAESSLGDAKSSLGDVKSLTGWRLGVDWLKHKLAPVLERIGKEVTLLLTPTAVTLLQDQDSTGSIRLHATFSPGLLFSDYRVESQNANKVCVRMSAAPLVRVLRRCVFAPPSLSTKSSNRECDLWMRLGPGLYFCAAQYRGRVRHRDREARQAQAVGG